MTSKSWDEPTGTLPATRRGMMLLRATRGLCVGCGQLRKNAVTCGGVHCEADFMMLPSAAVQEIAALLARAGDDGIRIGGAS